MSKRKVYPLKPWTDWGGWCCTKGHHAFDDFRRVCKEEFGEDIRPWTIGHGWARAVPIEKDIMVYATAPGRGAFPITEGSAR